MNLKNMVRGLIIAAVASALVYAVLIVVSDGPAVAAALRDFSPVVFAEMLALALGCYLVRSWRWGYLMRLVGYPVRFRDAVYLHFSGQTMSVSPGRVGEVLKPWLARETAGMPMANGVALVFSERVGDLIAVCLLSVGGVSVLGGGAQGLLAALAVIAVGTWVASSAWFHRLALKVVSRQRWAAAHRSAAESMSSTVMAALRWRPLLWSVLASVVAWGLEGVGFALCLYELGFHTADIPAAISIYAIATIIGAFTFLPGGIGLTEVSMTGILAFLGMAASGASAATLLTRVATLWWAVILGWVVIFTRPQVFRRLVRSGEAVVDEGADEAADGSSDR